MQIIPAREYLSPKELKALMKKDDKKAYLLLSKHWLIVIGAFILVNFYTNPLTIIISLFLLGGQQLACGILIHDASHYGIVKNRKLNNFIGKWLGAYPIFNNLEGYKHYHLIHHRTTGLDEDPDILLTRGYPAGRSSMFRKFLRDLTGITGVKVFFALMLMHLGFMKFNISSSHKIEWIKKPHKNAKEFLTIAYKNLGGPIVANLTIFGILWLIGAPWLYLLWIAAFFTTFQFCLRIRSIAEHAVVEDQKDPYLNTRTTKANWFEKLFFAPYNVNYHVEHHMLMAVPSYNLPKMHKILLERKFYEKGVLANGYLEIIKMAAKKK